MKLKDIKRGDVFTHCGHNWIVLEHDETGHTLALSEGIIGEMPFDENNCNNWGKSSLRKYLGREYIEELCGDTDPEKLGFCPYHLDLTADDGLKDYGVTTDFIFLLTCDLYRKNRDVIQPLDECWWTATALSARAVYSCNSRYVDTVGALNYNYAYNGDFGVRPACYLKSDLLLSDNNGIDDEITRFSKFDPDDRKIALDLAYALLEKYKGDHKEADNEP